jgi:AcrR family transcriptional regulator
VIQLLVEGGLDACTFQNVAERAGIERSTLYRRNPDRMPTIVDALVDHVGTLLPTTSNGSFRSNLNALLVNVRDLLAGPLGPPLLGVAAALQGGVSPGLLEKAWANRLLQLAPIFDLAIERGELQSDVDRDLLLASAAGPLFFHALIIGRPADDSAVQSIVDLVCYRFQTKT